MEVNNTRKEGGWEVHFPEPVFRPARVAGRFDIEQRISYCCVTSIAKITTCTNSNNTKITKAFQIQNSAKELSLYKDRKVSP